jgi:uncharacterized protein
MRHVPSLYNCLFHSEGQGRGYNFLYRSIVNIEPTTYEQVQDALADPSGQLASRLSLACQTALVDAGFLIPPTRNELDLITKRYHHQVSGLNVVNLTILPTLSCNLTCPYCFVRKKPGIMTQEVADAVVQWVKRAFRPKRCLHVSWLGGEPLMAKRVIQSLTESLSDVCRGWKGGYMADLITNGFYLDQDLIDHIEAWGLRSVHVTFGGDREHHDEERRQRRGGGSFDRILKNVERFCAASHQCPLVIRVNLTDANYTSVFELLKRFGPSVRARARIYFLWVWPNEASGCVDLAPQGRTIDSYRRLDALYQAANDSGWLTCNPALQFFDRHCEADSPNHFSIDPLGNLFQCTHTYDAADAIGSVFQPGTGLNDDQMDSYDSWYAANPFDDPECRACRLFPACWGGCRKARVLGGRGCLAEREAVEVFAEAIVRDHLRGLVCLSTNVAASPDLGRARGEVEVIKAKYIRGL